MGFRAPRLRGLFCQTKLSIPTESCSGLSDGQNLGEAAGIRIEGPNKRKTIIQVASKAEAAI